MKVNEFVERLRGKDAPLLYLSTQQQKQTSNPDSDTSTLPFQVPCEQLLEAGKIDKTLTWAGNLWLESCNLWMGCGSSRKQGSSSGLHHDFHDNFYLLLQGRKQFRLYSPDTAPHMEMFGEIDQIHFNGVISYKGNETRADGVPLEMMGENHDDEDLDEEEDEEEEELPFGKGFDYKSSDDEADFDENAEDDYDNIVGEGSDSSDKEQDDEDKEEDEKDEELPFGKGFDYKSSDDEADFDENAEDDFDKIVGEGSDSSDKEQDDEDKEEDEKDEELPFGKGFDYKSSDDEADFDENAEDDFDKIVGEGSNSDEEEARPKSFSRIDPATATAEEFPAFAKCREYIVNLKAGQSLYLPAGWFHNVTSFSSEEKDDNIHMAINYWYHPPDELKNFAKPYLRDPIDQKS
jgi:hypothetical protein